MFKVEEQVHLVLQREMGSPAITLFRPSTHIFAGRESSLAEEHLHHVPCKSGGNRRALRPQQLKLTPCARIVVVVCI